MHKFLSKLAQYCQKLRGLFPEMLPRGYSAFDKFAESIFKIYNIPAGDSYKNAIATMIMHLAPTVNKKSKYYFVKSIHKAMANQVAYEIIQEIKEADKKKKEEAATGIVSDVKEPLLHEQHTPRQAIT